MSGLRAQVPVSAYRYEVGAGTVPRPGSWTDFKLKPGLDTVSGKWLSLQDFPESVPVQGESKGVEACAIGFDFPFAGQSMAYFGLTGDGLIYFFPEEEASVCYGELSDINISYALCASPRIQWYPYDNVSVAVDSQTRIGYHQAEDTLHIRFENLLVGDGVTDRHFLFGRFRSQRWMNRLMKAREDENVLAGEDLIEGLQRNMSEEIECRDRELAAQALYEIKIRALMNRLADWLQLLRRSGLTQKEKLYVTEMQHLLDAYSPQGMEEFFLYFRRVEPDFWAKLEERFPGLGPLEKRLCALVWIGLSTKEIAVLTHRAASSVYTSKNRLKKKIGCSSGVRLYDFLRSMQGKS